MTAAFVVLYVPDWTQFIGTVIVIALLFAQFRAYRGARQEWQRAAKAATELENSIRRVRP